MNSKKMRITLLRLGLSALVVGLILMAISISVNPNFNGVNMSSATNPPPNLLGFAPPPSSANLGSIQGLINYTGYLGQSAAGRGLYVIAVFLAVAYYVLRINNENIKRTKKNRT